MNICVLSGSPKGKYSVTVQTVLFLQKHFPADSFEILHVGQTVRGLRQDFAPALKALQRADLLLFCYPVYTFLAPSQLAEFIHLLKAQKPDLRGKYAAQITTSKHFYDVTAHKYIEENCADLGLRYVGGLSADMDDLLCERGQGEAISFWNYVHFGVEELDVQREELAAVAPIAPYRRSLENCPKTQSGDTVIVADLGAERDNLREMMEDFAACYPGKTRLVNIREYPFAGGCLGCFRCAGDGKCIYKDGFDSFLRENIQSADAIVYAFTIQDHSMGHIFKCYDDRQFCNGHRTVTVGMPVGYLVDGDYDGERNLHTVIEGRAEVGQNFLAGVGTDGESIRRMAQTLAYAQRERLLLPQNFLGVGGMKIFRDLIYVMRGLMKADHKFYKEHGIYDFPQKKRGTILKMQFLGALTRMPGAEKHMGNKMNEGMIAPYQKVIDKQ
ncbi:MAG: NAD(P)H-dependent oxidoreductase [Oscillospiraceae bacterium]